MRSLIALTLLSGCGLMITEEEYLERITPQLSGVVRVPEGVYLPEVAPSLGLVEVTPFEVGLYADDPAVLLAITLEGVEPGATVAYEVALPPGFDGVDFGDLDPEVPGMTGQAWGLALWAHAEAGVDTGADSAAPLAFDASDHYLGASTTQVLAWIDEPQGRYLELGAIAGYNYLILDVDQQRVLSVTPINTTRPTWNLDASIAMTQRQDLNAFADLGIIIPATPRLDLFRMADPREFPEPTISSVPIEAQTGVQRATFELSFTEPRPEHLSGRFQETDFEALGVQVTAYRAISYHDVNGDGEWSGDDSGEGIVASSTSQDDDSYFVLCSRPVGFRAALLVQSALPMGWHLVFVDESGTSIAEWDDGILVD